MHGRGKAGVVKLLVKHYRGSKGLVDEDPQSPWPRFLRLFEEERRSDEHGLIVLAYREKGNRLVILRPRLEEWVLRAAKEAGVNVKDYGLPQDPYDLNKSINLELDKFGKLVKDLAGKSARLRALFKELKSD